MKCYYSDFEKHIHHTLHPFYIISGDEPFQKNQALEKILKKAKEHHFLTVSRIHTENSMDLYSIFFSKSLLEQKKCLIIDAQAQVPSNTLLDLLKQLEPDKDRLVIVLLPRVDIKIQKSAWFSHFENHGLHVSIWPISISQLPQWIIQYARTHDIQIQLDAAQLLSKMTEGNLLACSQIIEKCLLGGWKQIHLNMLSQMQEDPRPTLFSYVSTCLNGDLAKSLSDLQRLKQEGIELILILWGLVREFRLLLQAKLLGKSLSAIQAWQKTQRLPREHQLAQQQFCKRHTEETVNRLLVLAAKLDKILKGELDLDPWMHADMLILSCCQPPSSER